MKRPKGKKASRKNRLLERPSLIDLNHSSKIYKESGSENDSMEEIETEENMKNIKEITYTKIGNYNRGEWAKQQKIKNSKNDYEIPRNQEKMKKLLSPRK